MLDTSNRIKRERHMYKKNQRCVLKGQSNAFCKVIVTNLYFRLLVH